MLLFFFTFLWINSAVSWYGNIDYFTESILLPYNHNIRYSSLYYVVALCVEVPQHFDLIRLQHTLALILVPFVIILIVVAVIIIIIIIIIVIIIIIIIIIIIFIIIIIIIIIITHSLLQVVAGCQQYLDRLTWRHDSILNFIAKSRQPVVNVHSSLYADVNGFLNPLIITGENYCLGPSCSKDGERYPADKSLSSG